MTGFDVGRLHFKINLAYYYYYYYLSNSAKEIYDKEYKAFSKEDKDPLTRTHFTAEGEVTFRSILFVPEKAPAMETNLTTSRWVLFILNPLHIILFTVLFGQGWQMV